MSSTHELQTLYFQLLEGWNGRNADAMAECFSECGVLIGFDGSLMQGRTAVREHLLPIFTDHHPAEFVPIIRSIRMTAGVGILLADVGMVSHGAREIDPALNARQSMVAGKVDGQWQIELWQNTPAALHADEAGRDAMSAELSRSRE